eukprot:TRINITY_DN1625_c3_g1_i1.p1 TRINITY_DN1625_c3_g1~~TRINITY_DN1625_c3_g1_i1.p1  ORF type:complete len:655 (+),score=276.54 TRINITY_DN1625_c3_g1_i1:38-2002(+)
METSSYVFGFIIVGITYLLWQKKKPSQAAIVESDGEKVYRRAAYANRLVDRPTNGVQSMHELWEKSVEQFSGNKCTGTLKKLGKGKDGEEQFGDYEWKTYKDIHTLTTQFGSGLMKLGPKAGDRIGIFSKNREEWIIAQQACYAHSLVIVSFYETLGKDAIRYVAHHADIHLAVCSGESLTKMFEVIEGADGYKDLKTIIVMDDIPADAKERAKKSDITLYGFAEIQKNGAANPVPANPPKYDDLATIMYTSGTTGTPKGVLITHGNHMAEMGAIQTVIDLNPTDRYLSFLPMAHIFERVILTAVIFFGASAGFFRGDARNVVDDMKILQPTVFVGVPRIFDRAKAGIQKKVSEAPPVKQAVFKAAFALRKFQIIAAPSFPLNFLNEIVFKEARKALGGQVRLIVSSGAPLSYESEMFCRIVFGCNVSQAYGATETTGAATFKLESDPSVGHSGIPFACTEFKLDDLKDMGYTNMDVPHPRGEVCIRGPSVTQGYFKDDEKTKETFINGWYHTGDIGEITSDGTIRIVDRKKNMFKLAQGEYVASEYVEAKLLENSDVIEQLFVYGDSHETTLVAIVVPKQKGAKKDQVLSHIKEKGKQQRLQGFEIPQNVHVTEEAFTVENDLLTPTMKLKRNKLQEVFKKEIEKMYKEGPKR